MNKEVEELAKAIFIKSPQSTLHLTDGTRQGIESAIKSSIDVAQLFYNILDERKEAIKKEAIKND